MPLTREFRETIQARVKRDAGFRRAMLTEAVNALLNGDIEAGKAMLRDYVNATIGFKRLSVKLGRPSKSLQRMLGPNGNPTADNIFSIIQTLQEIEAVTLTVRSSRRTAAYPK